MRFLVKVCMPVEKFNAAVLDGTAGQKIKAAFDATKPESAYFYEEGGERTAMLIVNVGKPSEIPVLCEPWFLSFNAAVHLHPCMTPEELAASGIDQMGKKYR